MANRTQTDYLLTLAYLMGENTVQSSTTASRGQFIQSTLEEVYRAYRWPFASTRATLNVSGGVASLPSTFDYSHGIEAYFYSGSTQIPLEPIHEYDQTDWDINDYRHWLTSQADGSYLLNTKDTQYGSLVAKFQTKAPVVNATIAAPFEDAMTIALGARRYIKLSQNPDADISQDEALFQKRLRENIAAAQVSSPKRRLRFISQARGYRIGAGYED